MITLEVVALSPMAREWAERYRERRAARRLRDAHGRAVEIGEWRPEDWDGLLAMYRSFDPAQRALGLPPLAEERRAAWVDELCRHGPGVVARVGRRVVGHAALVAYDNPASYELVVFVHQEYQNAGIGTALLRALLALARRRGARRVWLTVDHHNAPARALYRRMGFECVSQGAGEERWDLMLPAATSHGAAWVTRTARRVARAWRRLEAGLESLPWTALGPAPVALIPASPAMRGDAAPERARETPARPPHAARGDGDGRVPLGAGAGARV